jgi:hypothetical protein
VIQDWVALWRNNHREMWDAAAKAKEASTETKDDPTAN